MATAQLPGGYRRHLVDVTDEAEQIRAAIAWYRERLAEPARLHWDPNDPLAPTTLGPVWEVDRTGHWVLPELTAGWDMLGFLSVWLNPAYIGRDRFEFTLEQARRILHWQAVDESGRWLWDDGVLQRVKGWGKDPHFAELALGTICGPALVAGVDVGRGIVHTEQHPNPLVQIVATAGEQTKTTMSLFPALVTPAFAAEYQIMVLKTMVTARGNVGEVMSVTSNPEKVEGFRPILTLLNETQHWREANRGIDMESVIRRNKNKVPGARVLRATNAPKMGIGSVAENDREKYDQGEMGPRFLYDSIEACRNARLNVEDGIRVIPMVRGDSVWLTTDMFLAGINDPRDTEETKRRFWYNQVGGEDERFIARQAWLDCAAGPTDSRVGVGDAVVLFGDGSKSGDQTAIAGCRISDGMIFTVGAWKPHGPDKLVDRAAVSRGVSLAMAAYNVVGFWWDPSPAQDDQLEQSYWTSECDNWAEMYGERLSLKAGPKHPIVWDMRDKVRFREFVRASEQFVDDAERAQLVHDGDRRMTKHMLNAVAHYTDHGVSLRKESRHSARKIDLAVCAVGARMMRRLVRADPEKYLPRRHRVV